MYKVVRVASDVNLPYKRSLWITFWLLARCWLPSSERTRETERSERLDSPLGYLAPERWITTHTLTTRVHNPGRIFISHAFSSIRATKQCAEWRYSDSDCELYWAPFTFSIVIRAQPFVSLASSPSPPFGSIVFTKKIGKCLRTLDYVGSGTFQCVMGAVLSPLFNSKSLCFRLLLIGFLICKILLPLTSEHLYYRSTQTILVRDERKREKTIHLHLF